MQNMPVLLLLLLYNSPDSLSVQSVANQSKNRIHQSQSQPITWMPLTKLQSPSQQELWLYINQTQGSYLLIPSSLGHPCIT